MLITNDYKSKFILSKLIILGISKNPNIQILCVPNLEGICKSIFGISAITFCLLKQQDEHNPYKKLHTKIIQLSQQCPISLELRRQYERTEEKPQNAKKTAITPSEKIDISSVYVTKRNDVRRGFIPNENTGNSDDYISIGSETIKEKTKSTKSKHKISTFNDILFNSGNKNRSNNYVQLRVNKIKNNPKKIKKH